MTAFPVFAKTLSMMKQM